MPGETALTDVEQLVADFEASDLRELHVRCGEFEIFLSKSSDFAGIGETVQLRADSPARTSAPAPAQEPAAATKPSAPAPADLPDGAVMIRAPYLGTFYRSPKPGAPAYVDIGSEVSDETEVCLVEVMKLFTSVRAGMDGKVHAILADDGDMVQADQPLFVLAPS